MRIFIASSNDLAPERKDLELLLHREKFDPIVWENIDHSITQEKFQDKINNDHLTTSDIVVFMVKSKLGQYTFQEFQEAYKELGKKIEKIYVYFFKESRDNIERKELKKILDLQDFLENEGKLYQEVKDFAALENHFLKQIKFFNNEQNDNIAPIIDSFETPQKNISSKNICIYTASPLHSRIDYNFGLIANLFKKFDVKVHHKIFNEDSLSEHYEFDFCFVFTKVNGEKIILEDEYFTQKSITLTELAEMIDPEKTKLFLDKDIKNDYFDVVTVETDAQIKRVLAGLLHKEINYHIGQSQTFKLNTDLPELIDKNNVRKFIGRNTDTENLIKKILTNRNENKILTIKGSGGIGKTTLVSKVVVEIAKRGKFGDGIKFVQCEYIKDYEDFENKISFAFDMSNAINFKIQLKEHIGYDEQRLIILDNVETILHVEETQRIKEFIKFISDFATIIVTSREKLNEEFEEVYEVRNLSTDEAEELFLNQYPLKNYDTKFLRIEILENMLNNNPLAIKIVTKNLPKNKDLKILKDELDNSFFDITTVDIENIFKNETDTNIERTKSLFNSINYSYSRLSEKEKLALELLSLFPDGIHMEHFKTFYNQKESNDKNNKKTMKKKIENFSDTDLKSLEDKSLIINSNQVINLQSIIGRFADFKFNSREEDEKIEYYKKAYNYNAFILEYISNDRVHEYIGAHIFDKFKNNFLKCLEYMCYLDVNEKKLMFIRGVKNSFAMSSSPNKKVLERLSNLKNSLNKESIEEEFITIMILSLEYYYGNFSKVYSLIQGKYPINNIIARCNPSSDRLELRYETVMDIYSMEGNQFQDVKFDLAKGQFGLSVFMIGEYKFIEKYINKYKDSLDEFLQFQFELNMNLLDTKSLKKYISSLYKTQFIDKTQSTYTLLRADKNEVSLKDIKKLILTNPFTDGLKTLMLAIKDEKNCSKRMFEEAVEKLYHIRYYHVEAILLYCRYLKNIQDEDYKKWFDQGKELAQKHYYRYLLHQFNCLDSGVYSDYNEDDYPLPEKLDYSVLIKKFDL